MAYHSFEFNGKRRRVVDALPMTSLPKSLLLVGKLEELVAETPVDDEMDASKLLTTSKSRRNPFNINPINAILEDDVGSKKLSLGKKPLVCASSDGKLGVIVPADLVEGVEEDANQLNSVAGLDDAISLHTDFHGVKPPKIIKINTQKFDHLIFYGWLKHIVYDVPKYSERRGPAFIHEAGDKGEGVAPAKQKPIICHTPSKDMILLFGREMKFTDRGFIG